MTKVFIQYKGFTAWTEGDAWQANIPPLADLLNREAGPESIQEYSPDLAISMARRAEEILGVTVTKIERDDDEQGDDVVY